MKKTTFTKIASAFVMLAMIAVLTAAFVTGAGAETTVQAVWGATSAEADLTNSGTLQEALDAAAATDSTVGYIKLVSDVALGEGVLAAIGGDFTLDLSGYTVTADGYVLCLSNAVNITVTDTSTEQDGKIQSTGNNNAAIAINDDTAIQFTVEGGTLIGDNYAIAAQNNGWGCAASITVTGGRLQEGGVAHISWMSTGRLDISQYANAAGFKIEITSGTDILIPENCSFYDSNGEKVLGALTSAYYTVDVTQYALTLNFDDGVDGENSSFTHGGGMLLPGTAVTVDPTLLEHYKLISVTLNGEALTPDAETGAYTFTMPEADAELVITTKYVYFAWGASANAP